MEEYKYYKGMYDIGWIKELPRRNIWHKIYQRTHYDGGKFDIIQYKHGIIHGPLIKFKYN